MNKASLGILGLCRRAGKLSMGHDMCKASLNAKKAKLCLISSESSQRVREEFENLCRDKNVPFFTVPLSINEIHSLIGYKAGIITVDDSGFADSLIKKLQTELTFGEESL